MYTLNGELHSNELYLKSKQINKLISENDGVKTSESFLPKINERARKEFEATFSKC
jgi:hypothetical protein